MDCDMLARGDIAELWQLRDERHALMVVKHEHLPGEAVKFLGAEQTRYAKKNWSSLILFQCERCTALSRSSSTAPRACSCTASSGSPVTTRSAPCRWTAGTI
jgi:hypothetical protein